MVKIVGSLQEYEVTIGEGITVVDFYADWCGPCKAIAPKVEEFSRTYTNAKFIKVNVDDAGDIAQKYDIRAMPTFHIYHNGTKIDELVGANPSALLAKIQKAVV